MAGGDDAVFRHHLGGAAAQVVVGTGHGQVCPHLAEQHRAVCHAGAACSGGAVVVPSVEPGAVHHVANQLAAVVVGEHIVAGGTRPRERAGSRATQCVVPVGASWRNRSCGDADHALVYTPLSTQKAKCTTINAFFSKKIAVGLQGT